MMKKHFFILFPARRFFRSALSALFTAALFAFTATPTNAADRVPKKLRVVATFSILGDMARIVGGERLEIHTLIGHDSDAHVWRPSPADSRALARANLVVANGLGFETWVERLIESSGFRGVFLAASRGVKTRAFKNGASDPHAWLDLSNAALYVDNIANAFATADPGAKDRYFENASRYKKEILALDAKIRRSFDTIPPAYRKAVTSHNAFGYFADAYGIEFISTLDAAGIEPSARDIGRLIEKIREEEIPAVFLENISDPRLLGRIRAESGAKMGGAIYSDALSGKDGPAATYLDMMRHNAETITRALSGIGRQKAVGRRQSAR
jgi:zinc/manganese transport system substrate-binding protein